MSAPTPSLADLGYRFPAEWEPREATWISWPHNADTWFDQHALVYEQFARIVAELARSEIVHINVNDAAMEAEARAYLQRRSIQGDIRFHRFPTDDAWCRDYGAIFLTSDRPGAAPCVAVDWGYNAWGNKYPPFDQDASIPAHMAAVLEIPCYSCDLIVEGGALESNGAGLLLTTESCLLHPQRNPDVSRDEIERTLMRMLGSTQVVWLRQGFTDDETDGHIDNIARFVAPDMVVAVVEANPADVNYAPFQENLARLQATCGPDGRPLRVVQLPTPAPIFHNGQRMPGSYANFYIARRSVLMPTFNQPGDAVAQAILQNLFPDRKVVGIDCTGILLGGGAIHCLTQPQPYRCAPYDQ